MPPGADAQREVTFAPGFILERESSSKRADSPQNSAGLRTLAARDGCQTIHFGKSRNFEHSLLKMVTRRKRSATTSGSDYPQGNSLVVQVSGGTLTRTSGVAPPSNDKSDFGDKGSTQFLSGAVALLFFFQAITAHPFGTVRGAAV